MSGPEHSYTQLKAGKERFAAQFIFPGDSPSLVYPCGQWSTDPAWKVCDIFGIVEKAEEGSGYTFQPEFCTM